MLERDGGGWGYGSSAASAEWRREWDSALNLLALFGLSSVPCALRHAGGNPRLLRFVGLAAVLDARAAGSLPGSHGGGWDGQLRRLSRFDRPRWYRNGSFDAVMPDPDQIEVRAAFLA